MVERSELIWKIFRAIETDERSDDFWRLLEQLDSEDGLVYMTYASQTPMTLAQQLQRSKLSKLIQIHENLICIRARFLL